MWRTVLAGHAVSNGPNSAFATHMINRLTRQAVSSECSTGLFQLIVQSSDEKWPQGGLLIFHYLWFSALDLWPRRCDRPNVIADVGRQIANGSLHPTCLLNHYLILDPLDYVQLFKHTDNKLAVQ